MTIRQLTNPALRGNDARQFVIDDPRESIQRRGAENYPKFEVR